MFKKLLILPLGVAVILYAFFGFCLLYGKLLPPVVMALIALILIFPVPFLPLSQAMPAGTARRIVHRIGEATIGVYLYTLIVLVADATVFYICLLFSLPAPSLPIVAACSAAALALILTAAILNARRIRVKRHTLVFDGCGKEGKMRAVVFSDLHLGFFTTKSFLRRLQKAVNQEDADCILFAGDLFDSDLCEIDDPDFAADVLKNMKRKDGFFACTGNHDLYAASDSRQTDFYKEAGVTLLRDEGVCLPLCSLYGRKDSSEKDRVKASDLPDTPCPLIVLDHRPDDIKALAGRGVDLAVCGHTHGGQTFPGNLTARLLSRYAYGLHASGKTKVLTTSGAGYWGVPLRLFVNNEIVVLDISMQK